MVLQIEHCCSRSKDTSGWEVSREVKECQEPSRKDGEKIEWKHKHIANILERPVARARSTISDLGVEANKPSQY